MPAKQLEIIAEEWHDISEQLCWRVFPLGGGVVDQLVDIKAST